MATRTDDEILLTMVEYRSEGHSPAVIGSALGIAKDTVRRATNKVRQADAEESGKIINGAYW